MEKPNSDENLKPEILVEAATVEEEIQRVRHCVHAFETITKETSDVVMPKGLDVKHKSHVHDTEKLTREEYDPSFYTAGVEWVRAAIPTIQEAVEILGQYQQAWGFELEKSYKVIITRYGTGGSYDTLTKEVLMRVTREGKFSREDAADTPIHEITHLCVEHLVERFKLTFAEKERLVEGIDITLFPRIFDPNGTVSDEKRQTRLALLADLPAFIAQTRPDAVKSREQ
jgi:hypothetical protein